MTLENRIKRLESEKLGAGSFRIICIKDGEKLPHIEVDARGLDENGAYVVVMTEDEARL